jgi:hypothetical protein
VALTEGMGLIIFIAVEPHLQRREAKTPFYL